MLRRPFANAERSSDLYSTERWRRERATYLARQPYCQRCTQQARLIRATVVDHSQPHRGDPVLFWDQRNWQSLCARHSNEKTAREVAQRYDRRRPAEAHPGYVR